MWGRGSGPVLAVLVVAFLGAFAALRGTSRFLRVEAEVGTARQLAAAHGLAAADVLALREQAADLPAAAFAERVARFARERTGLGDPLAAVAVAGQEAAARAALQRAGGDPGLAWRRFRADPAAFAGLRFLQMRARFLARTAARTRD